MVKHRMRTSTSPVPCGVNPRFSVPKIDLMQRLIDRIEADVIPAGAGLEKRLRKQLGLLEFPDEYATGTWPGEDFGNG